MNLKATSDQTHHRSFEINQWRKARHLVESDVEDHLRTFCDSYIAADMDHQQAVQTVPDMMAPARNMSRLRHS